MFTKVKNKIQREDYWMKTLLSICSYGLNERAKFMNKRSLIRKHFPPLPRYGELFIDTRTRSKVTNHDLPSDIEIFFSVFLKQFLIKYRSNECQKLLKLLERKIKN